MREYILNEVVSHGFVKSVSSHKIKCGVIFLLKNCEELFAIQKLLTFSCQKMAVFYA